MVLAYLGIILFLLVMGLLQQSQWLKQCLQNNVKWFDSTNESPGKRGNNELRRCNEKRRFIYQN